MINFSLNIRWPWLNAAAQHDYFYKTWRVSKNKSLEVQLTKAGKTLFGFSFNWEVRTDHAGVSFSIDLLGRFLYVTFNDNRHWNDEEDRYVNYNDPKEVEKYL